MRLIDADALYRKVKAECNPYGKPFIDWESGQRMMEWIEHAPTVTKDTNVPDKWVSVKDRLPEEHESIFSRFKGSERWSKAMWVMESKIVLVVAAMPDKWSTVTTGNLHDGKWCTRIPPMIDYKVTHWMPLPEPPEEG